MAKWWNLKPTFHLGMEIGLRTPKKKKMPAERSCAREAGIRKKVKEWNTKLKRTKTMLKKYEQKLKYYERKKMAASQKEKEEK